MALICNLQKISCSVPVFSKKLTGPWSSGRVGPLLNIMAYKFSSRRTPDVSDIPELNEPPLKKFYEAYYQPGNGRIHDKKPFKLRCTKGKIYYWCICGWSHDQPLCDGKCILPEMKIKLKPVVFKPNVTRDYWFCNCKQTKNRPFCDGSHNSEAVQTAYSVIRR